MASKKKKKIENKPAKATRFDVEVLKKILKKPKVKKGLLISGGAVVLLALMVFSFNLSYSNKVFPRTYIGGLNIGGLTKEDALVRLKEKTSNIGESKVVLNHNERKWEISSEELKIARNPEKTVEAAYEIGRHGSFFSILKQQMKAVFVGNRLLCNFTYDRSVLNEKISLISKEIDVPEKDATVIINQNLETEIQTERKGQKVNIDNLEKNILKGFGRLTKEEKFSLPVEIANPKISKEQASKAAEVAKKYLKNDIELTSSKKNFEVTKENIAGWVDFIAVAQDTSFVQTEIKGEKKGLMTGWILKAEINQGKVQQFIDSMAGEIFQEPKDAKFEMQGNRAVAFQVSQTGYELNKEQVIKDIVEAIKKGDESIELAVKVTEPEVSSNSAESLGIRELVGLGTTNFSGSPQNRKHNISVGAKSFHGVIIKPGEEFSTIKYLGQIDASTGYLPELVIKEDRTIPEYGGGLCQVSTTLFRAAMNAGLKITERTNHSYRVRYYEPPVGMDATIYYPKPDFKFVNDYRTHILVQAEISGNDITFRFYGTKDGRKSEISEPYVYDVTGTGEPVYTESPDLAAGEIKQIEKPHPGAKASFTYKVTDASGKVLSEDKFNSSYVPWPARYLYGPGTQIPPVE